jgi:hypothetical protein
MKEFKQILTETKSYDDRYNEHRGEMDAIEKAGGNLRSKFPKPGGKVRFGFEVTVVEKYPATWRTELYFTHDNYTRINNEVVATVGYVNYEATPNSTMRKVTTEKKFRKIGPALRWINSETRKLKKLS